MDDKDKCITLLFQDDPDTASKLLVDVLSICFKSQSGV